MADKYRPNVAAILQRPDGKILVAERTDTADAWQFPQGGVDPGEDLIGALLREVEEEIGVGRESYDLEQCRTGYRYKFPNGHLKKGVWVGQEQTYFLCRFRGSDAEIDVGDYGEFARFRWIEPDEFRLNYLPKFKRKVYRRVFDDFFGVKLEKLADSSDDEIESERDSGSDVPYPSSPNA